MVLLAQQLPPDRILTERGAAGTEGAAMGAGASMDVSATLEGTTPEETELEKSVPANNVARGLNCAAAMFR